MDFFFEDSQGARPLVRASRTDRYGVSLPDIAALLLVGATVLVFHGAAAMDQPLSQPKSAPVTLDLAQLPEYALRSTLRMFAVLAESLVFTFIVGTVAAKSRLAALLIILALDILQSVPVPGLLSFTVTLPIDLDDVSRQLGFSPWLSARRVREQLQTRMSETFAQQTVRSVVKWGRYAEAFDCDEKADRFSLEDVV